jgi:hypothetical protein
MFERCLNPDCGLPFDHREGRLVRVSSPGTKSPAGPTRIEHFWLCGKCSERYVFPHEREAGMKIRLRVEESQETEVRDSAATPKPWERAGYREVGAIVVKVTDNSHGTQGVNYANRNDRPRKDGGQHGTAYVKRKAPMCSLQQVAKVDKRVGSGGSSGSRFAAGFCKKAGESLERSG